MRLMLRCVVFLFLMPAPSLAPAAEPSPETTQNLVFEDMPLSVTAKGAPVMLDGRTLFYLQGISSYPAEIRAKIVAQRIRAAAIDPTFSAEKVTMEEKDDRTTIVFGSKPLVTIVDLDASTEGVTRKILAEVIRARIILGVKEYHAARQPRVLIQNAGYAIAAALLFVAMFYSRRKKLIV